MFTPRRGRGEHWDRTASRPPDAWHPTAHCGLASSIARVSTTYRHGRSGVGAATAHVKIYATPGVGGASTDTFLGFAFTCKGGELEADKTLQCPYPQTHCKSVNADGTLTCDD